MSKSDEDPFYKFSPEHENATIKFLDPQPNVQMYATHYIGKDQFALCDSCSGDYKAKMKALVNAYEIIYVREPIPVRKKKPWMRYTSQKKWASRFPKRVHKEYSASPRVLSLTDNVLKKINDLAASQTQLEETGSIKTSAKSAAKHFRIIRYCRGRKYGPLTGDRMCAIL